MKTTCTSLVCGMLLIALIMTGPLLQGQSTGWLDPAWAYRNPVTISNPNSGQLSNFQVRLHLDSSFNFTNAKNDGSDLRVAAGDGVTAIPFWIESWNVSQLAATVWVQVPLLPTTGTTIYLYYGNPRTASLSSGSSTFDLFDDFQSANGSSPGYFKLGAAQTALVQDQAWEVHPPHTLSILPVNSGGYTYWGYYGTQGCDGAGLAFSNDLVTWTEYTGNPLLTNARWPSVLQVGNVYYMLYDKDYCTTPQIVLASSADGIKFTDIKTIVPANYLGHGLNDNPQLYLNPNDGKYYIYWYSSGSSNAVMARSASSPEGLDDTSSEATVLTSTGTVAAPNILFYNGTYFLTTETLDSSGTWNVEIYSSSLPTSGFTLLPGNPVLGNGSACMLQYIFGTTLHDYYCKLTNSTWTVEHRAADLTAGRSQFPIPNSSTWSNSGGGWTIVSDTRPDGSTGLVLQANTTSPEILYSTYSGSDYMVEAHGKQIQGRVWGLGARVNDPGDFYSVNLYDDLGTTQNLYTYVWQGGGASVLGSAAVGQVNPNTWYKLGIKVEGSAINIYKDDVLQLQTASAGFSAGAVALYGEGGTLANFSDIRVRKAASFDPIGSVGSTQLSVAVSALSLNPASLTGGSPSVGTVTLSGPAPNTGITVALLNNNPAAATVPSSVIISPGATGATFPVTTLPVATSASVTVSASYGSGTQTATVVVIPPVPSSLALNPASLTGGSSSLGTVTLNGPAPSGGASVTLSSGNAAAAVPASVVVPAGASSATFAVTTGAVASVTAVSISASYGGGTQRATLTVMPPVLSSLALNPSTVTAGNSSTGTVTLNGPAPSGGASVMLSSSSSSATTPSSVTIPAGATTANFTVNTSLVVIMTTQATIQASYNNTNKTANLTIQPVVPIL